MIESSVCALGFRSGGVEWGRRWATAFQKDNAVKRQKSWKRGERNCDNKHGAPRNKKQPAQGVSCATSCMDGGKKKKRKSSQQLHAKQHQRQDIDLRCKCSNGEHGKGCSEGLKAQCVQSAWFLILINTLNTVITMYTQSILVILAVL